MTKKRRRIGSGTKASETNYGAEDPPPTAQQKGAAAKQQNNKKNAPLPLASPEEKKKDLSEADVDLLLRAAKTMCSYANQRRTDMEEAAANLSEAMAPLITARVSKYQEDAKANKLQEAAAGNPANAQRGFGAISNNSNKKRAAAGGMPGPGDDEEEDELLDEELVEVTRASSWLAQNPDILNSKACKPLRAALHPLVETHIREEKASPAFRITCALGQRHRWPEALKTLGELRKLEPGKRPKLGAYQRWTREINASFGSPEELGMLDAIMRVAAGFGPSTTPSPEKGRLFEVPPWRPDLPEEEEQPATTPAISSTASATPPSNSGTSSNVAGAGAAAAAAVDGEEPSMVNRLSALIATRRGEAAAAAATASAKEGPWGPNSWSIIDHEPGHTRTPPNQFDLDIYCCRPGVVSLTKPASRPTQRHQMPYVEGGLSLTDVLSKEECKSLVDLTEAIGYRPDLPVSSPMDERAHNVVLFASEEQNDALFSRVKHLLPPESGGARLQGINRRWRIYRYKEGNAYRKHIDGAWPASGLKTGSDGKPEYAYDAYGGSTRSRYTFIIYLNDDFEGGCTTFFLPKAGEEGTLESRPIKPRCGSASVFPHGELPEPLLHEGSPVVKGAKYLLRTDVVYTTGESSETLKEAKRLRGLARQLGGLGGKDLVEDMVAGVPDGKAGNKKVAKTAATKNPNKKNKFAEKKEGKKMPGKEGKPGKEGGVIKSGKKGQRMQPGSGKRGGRKK